MSGSAGTSPRSPRPSACAPCGLWAASSRIVGLRRITSSRPGEVTSANASLTRSASSGSVADERLHGGQREHRVLRLVGAVQREEELVVLAAQPAQRHHLAAHGGDAVLDPEVDALAQDAWRRPRAARSASTASTSSACSAHDDLRAGLDDPGLLDGDLGGAGAEVARVVDRDRRDHRDGPSATLVASHEPPIPTSRTATSSGRVGERGVRHADDRLEERQRVRRRPASTRSRNGATSR